MPESQDLAQSKIRQRFLVGMVVLLVIAINLPSSLLALVHIDRTVLIAALGLLIFLALFLYMRLFFFLLFIALIVGANLPDQIADSLGISRTPMLIALVVMVTGSLLNNLTLSIPTGAGVRKRKDNKLALESLMKAIEKGRAAGVQAVLEIDFDLDQLASNGLTPLMYAAQLGHARIVSSLLQAGARREIVGPQGNAAEIAARAGHATLAEILQPPVSAPPVAAVAALDAEAVA